MRIVIEDVLTVTMNDRNEIDTLTIIIEGEKISALARSSDKQTYNKRNDDCIISGKNR